MIIAICHQREVNDNRLAASVPAGTLDLIAAGHDHDYRYSKINGCHVLCSGSDFKNLSYIEARRRKDGAKGWDFDIVRRDVTKDVKEDEATKALMDKLFASFRAKLEKPIGYTSAPLDARFSTVRKSESNYANFVADLLRNYYNGDCAIIVGGTIRGDQVYTPGIIRIKDLMDCFPFEDPDVMVSTPGHAIRDALENGVSKWPALEGRFPQVSNIHYAFDPSKPEGQRITSVKIGGKPIELQKQYKLVTRSYTISGGGKFRLIPLSTHCHCTAFLISAHELIKTDGFSSLRLTHKGGHSTYVVDEENGSLTSTLLRQYFMSLKVLNKWKQWTPQLDHHWGGVCDNLHKVQPVRAPTTRSPSIRSVPSPVTMRGPKRQKTSDSTDILRTNGAVRGEGEGVGLGLQDANPQPPVTLNAPTSITPTNDAKADVEVDEVDLSSDSEGEDEEEDASPPSPVERRATQRRLHLARKVMRRWRRKVGIKGEPGLCDEVSEGVHWTQGIAPRIEGRITIIGHT